MNNWKSQNDYYYGYGILMTPVVKMFLLANIIAFLVATVSPAMVALFGLVPMLVTAQGKIWQFVTYMFVHMNFWHLLVNILVLYFFGPALEQRWGSKAFLRYYLYCGIGAGLCSYLVNINSSSPVIGASGAIFGLLVAYALAYPDQVVLVFFMIPMRIAQAVVLFIIIDLLLAVLNPGSGIAYFAHLGGAAIGYVYLKSAWLRRKLFWLPSELSRRKHSHAPKKASPSPKPNTTPEEIDRILDKISQQGMDSLTPQEKQALRSQARSKA